ncbi:MAG TPA: hypothetical protein VGZ25_00950 [Gemmataceae bacterium]|nr:hypothetical protein [Gemmataceae bacterium]
MSILLFVLHLTGAYPLWRCWQANRESSLLYAVFWTVLAWAAWGYVLLSLAVGGDNPTTLMLYMALCLSSCAGVAVLGARRPGDGAWNFVVVGLLAVLLLPVAQGWGQPNLSAFWIGFLVTTLSVVGFNYVLTRLGPAALACLLGYGCVTWAMVEAAEDARILDTLVGKIGLCLIAASPWAAFLFWRFKSRSQTVFDQMWLDFRDRYGMIWALRVRDQFNRSAKNAEWPVLLGWSGLNSVGPWDSSLAVPPLEALLKRFGPPDT